MEVALEEIAVMFKIFMRDAFVAGQEYELTDHAVDTPDFDEWFDTNYGAIIESGKNRRESENTP